MIFALLATAAISGVVADQQGLSTWAIAVMVVAGPAIAAGVGAASSWLMIPKTTFIAISPQARIRPPPAGLPKTGSAGSFH
ncbi:MAG: hypothetical protein J2P37_12415 [Ktedonobacteraceae bacterium]|nr:hypothetical protein [Ktedonobacteraceae bacterium]MBO0795715.1 hypothetical protein [Ktedonobacteraceae bacterium]